MSTVPSLPFGLRRRLTAVFLTIILGLSLLNAFNLFWIAAYFREFSGNLSRQENLQELISGVRNHQAELFNYSRSSNPEYLSDMEKRKQRIRKLIDEELTRNREIRQVRYRLRDISRMLDTLFETEVLLFRDADRGISSIYLQDRGDELVRLSNYIISDLQLVAEGYMQELSDFYQEFSRRISRISTFSLTLLIIAMVFAIYTARRFVLTVSRPIHQLAIQLVRFGKGDLEARVGEIGARDEIEVLVRSYDDMADRIRGLIGDIRDKAELEQRLRRTKAGQTGSRTSPQGSRTRPASCTDQSPFPVQYTEHHRIVMPSGGRASYRFGHLRPVRTSALQSENRRGNSPTAAMKLTLSDLT